MIIYGLARRVHHYSPWYLEYSQDQSSSRLAHLCPPLNQYCLHPHRQWQTFLASHRLWKWAPHNHLWLHFIFALMDSCKCNYESSLNLIFLWCLFLNHSRNWVCHYQGYSLRWNLFRYIWFLGYSYQIMNNLNNPYSTRSWLANPYWVRMI